MFSVQYLPLIAELLLKNYTEISAKTEGFSLELFIKFF